jgi:hypothetical protein
VPDSTQAVTDPDKTEQAASLTQNPTASHALAQEALDADVRGVAQQEHDQEVVDLGWNEPKELIAAPLVGGMDNEELWMLTRRFNKVCMTIRLVLTVHVFQYNADIYPWLQQMYHVKECLQPPPGNLDLNVADDEEFSPDKLRANLERLYMTVGLGLMGFGKQTVRLRSWRETRRTSCFCAVSPSNPPL